MNAQSTSSAQNFFDTTQDLYLVQNVADNTRFHGDDIPSLLDYIFTAEENMVDNLDYGSSIGKSDHVCLTWDYMSANCEEERKLRN